MWFSETGRRRAAAGRGGSGVSAASSRSRGPKRGATLDQIGRRTPTAIQTKSIPMHIRVFGFDGPLVQSFTSIEGEKVLLDNRTAPFLMVDDNIYKAKSIKIIGQPGKAPIYVAAEGLLPATELPNVPEPYDPSMVELYIHAKPGQDKQTLTGVDLPRFRYGGRSLPGLSSFEISAEAGKPLEVTLKFCPTSVDLNFEGAVCDLEYNLNKPEVSLPPREEMQQLVAQFIEDHPEGFDALKEFLTA